MRRRTPSSCPPVQVVAVCATGHRTELLHHAGAEPARGATLTPPRRPRRGCLRRCCAQVKIRRRTPTSSRPPMRHWRRVNELWGKWTNRHAGKRPSSKASSVRLAKPLPYVPPLTRTCVCESQLMYSSKPLTSRTRTLSPWNTRRHPRYSRGMCEIPRQQCHTLATRS